MNSNPNKILVKRLFKTKFKPIYTKSLEINVPTMLLKEINTNQIKNLIDLGSGYGYLLYSLERNNLLPSYAVGIESDIEKCKAIKQEIPNLNIICGNMFKLSIPESGNFGLVINEQVIEHLEDEKSLLEMIAGLLKPKGRLYISSIIRKKYAWWIYKYKGQIRLNPNHIREYSSEQAFGDLLSRNGFKVISLNQKPFFFSLSYWLEICLVNFGLIKADQLRRRIDQNSFLGFLHKYLKVPIPGFYLIEALAEKNV